MKDQAYYDAVSEQLIRTARHNMKAYDFPGEPVPDEYLKPDRAKGVPDPDLEKPFPDGAATVDLPSIETIDLGSMPLIEAFRKRRSRRSFSDDPLALEELAYLCWSVAGVHQVAPNDEWTRRTAPSGGARHPFETYLVVERVTGLEPGIYRYSGLRRQLVLVKPGTGFCGQLAGTALQSFVQKSAVIFIWTAIPYRNEWKYMFTGAKQMAMDLGHYCQNLYLACESIEGGTCAIAAYRQELLDELLGVDGEDEFTMYVAPVGRVKG